MKTDHGTDFGLYKQAPKKHEIVESPPPPPLEKPPIDETTDSTVASEPKKKTPPSKPIRRSSQRSLASNSPKSEQPKDAENSSVSLYKSSKTI